MGQHEDDKAFLGKRQLVRIKGKIKEIKKDLDSDSKKWEKNYKGHHRKD